jgi:hypothetical protein
MVGVDVEVAILESPAAPNVFIANYPMFQVMMLMMMMTMTTTIMMMMTMTTTIMTMTMMMIAGPRESVPAQRSRDVGVTAPGLHGPALQAR